MRLLSIGRPLPNRMIDNHTLFNAPALFDYPAIVLDIAAIARQVADAAAGATAYTTADDTPIADGDGVPGTLGLGELLRRRREEVARALDHGAVVAVFAAPAGPLPPVAGLHGADRYWLLPAPAGLAWDATLVKWAEGTGAGNVDATHPFARVFDAIRPDLLYRAYLDDHAPGFAGAGQVFARSAGGAPIGVHWRVGNGHVVFLPTPRLSGGDGAATQAEALLAACEDLLDVPAGDAPGWLVQHEVPGLTATTAAAAAAARDIERATAQLHAAEAEAAPLRALQAVLWERGHSRLLRSASGCLEALGFRCALDDAGALTCWSAGEELIVEAEAADGAVGMAPHYRLRARLDAILAAEGRAARGLIVVNGERLRDPVLRDTPYVDALRVGAEATRYAVIVGPDLFAAARLALAQPKTDCTPFRQRLLETDGVIDFADLIGIG